MPILRSNLLESVAPDPRSQNTGNNFRAKGRPIRLAQLNLWEVRNGFDAMSEGRGVCAEQPLWRPVRRAAKLFALRTDRQQFQDTWRSKASLVRKAQEAPSALKGKQVRPIE